MSILKRIFRNANQNDESMLQAQAAAGNEFEAWKESPVGRYVILRAEQEELANLRDLATTHPSNKTRLIQLQERAKMFKMFQSWIEEVITEGVSAEFQLKELSAEEPGY